MKKFIFILTIVLLVSCNSDLTTKRHNYIVLIDNSKSVTDETLDKYIDVIQNTILHKLGRYDKLTIQFIDECTLTKSERVFELDLSKIDFSLKNVGLNKQQDSLNSVLKSYLTDTTQINLSKTLHSKRKERLNCGNYTDIINALNESTSLIINRNTTSSFSKVLNNAQGEDNFEYENVIILFSDMVNENRDKTYDFTQMAKFDESQINQKIDDLRNGNKIPELNNCQIFVYGVTSTASQAYSNRQIENVKLFWDLFFKMSGANLRSYGYDTKLEIDSYTSAINP